MFKIKNSNKNKIIEIDNIYYITNGTLDEMNTINNPNQIGKVVRKDTGEIVTEITPLFMIINQNAINFREKLDVLIKNGGDMHMKINYYGTSRSAKEIMNLYRSESKRTHLA